jgi:predicted histone-like DNA-binding protein
MAMKVKAVERLVKFEKEAAGKYRYVMQPELYTSLAQEKVIKEASLRSGISKGAMQACWDAAGEVIKAWATEGHSVALPGLGTMRFGLRAKAVESVNDVKTKLIKSRRIIFTPSVDLKDELANTSIQITCYDRNGEVVKRVSSDAGEIEDPDDTDDNGTGGGTTNSGNDNDNENENPGTTNGGSQNQNQNPSTDDGDNTGGNNGGGSNTGDGWEEG